MIFRTKHALGIHATTTSVSVVWISSRTNQPPQCHRVWQIAADDVAPFAQTHEWPQWPRATTLAVALEDTVAQRTTVSLPSHLSWRDRRFQQALEMSLQHPELSSDVVVDDDAHGRVCAIPQSLLMHWQSLARTLKCRLHWLGTASALEVVEIAPHDEWRWAQAATQTPVALKAALVALRLRTAATREDLHAWRPNWVQRPWQHDWVNMREQTLASCSRAWQAAGMNTRRAMLCAAAGAVLSVGAMNGLQAMGQARDALTSTQAQRSKLQGQHRELLSAQQARQSQRAADARERQALQPFVAQGQLSVQWLQMLMQAQGVWLHELRVHTSRVAPLGEALGDAHEDKAPLRWRLHGEALSPAQAQSLRQALQALSGWHKPPTETQGHWQYGQEGRASVWAFVIEAELPCPC